jgi:plasmid stabilization system protein ParE
MPAFVLALSLSCAAATQSATPSPRPWSSAAVTNKTATSYRQAPLAVIPWEDRRDIAGDPGDVHTSPGRFDGYSVELGCADREDSHSVVVVRGLGTKSYRQLAGSAVPENQDEARRFWRAIADSVRRVADVPSIHRSSMAKPCRGTEPAVQLDIHDFRDVDDAIRAIGTWQSKMDFGGEVLLLLVAAPLPSMPM